MSYVFEKSEQIVLTGTVFCLYITQKIFYESSDDKNTAFMDKSN